MNKNVEENLSEIKKFKYGKNEVEILISYNLNNEKNGDFAFNVWPSGLFFKIYFLETLNFSKAFVLCEYICRKSNFQDYCILELGSGTGICSIVASKCGAKEVIATDFDNSVILGNIEKNFVLNNINNFQVKGFEWGHFDAHWLEFSKKQMEKKESKKFVIIGSDCFYDSSFYDSLLCSIYFLLSKCNCESFITSYQVRSEKSISPLLKKWKLESKIIDLDTFLEVEEINNMDYEIMLVEFKLCTTK